MASNQTTNAIYHHGDQLQIDTLIAGGPPVDHDPGAIVILATNFAGVTSRGLQDSVLGAVDIKGVYKVAKDNVDTFGVGSKVSWDDTNKQAEPNAGPNEDCKIGICVWDAVAGDDFVLVALNMQPNV